MLVPPPDWSIAPEGTTHYSLVRSIGTRWLKAEKVDGKYEYYYASAYPGRYPIWRPYSEGHESIALHHFGNSVARGTFVEEEGFLPWEAANERELKEFVRGKGRDPRDWGHVLSNNY